MENWTKDATIGKDPLPKCNYRFEVDGIPAIDFHKVDMPEKEWGTFENREPTADGTTQTTTTTLKPMEVSFMRRFKPEDNLAIDALEDWFLNGSSDKRGGSIVYLDKKGGEVRRYNFFDGFLKKFKPPENESPSDDPMEFTMTMVISNYTRG